MPDPKLPTVPVMTIDNSSLIRGRKVEVKEPDLTERINRVITRFPNIELDFARDTIEFPRRGSVLDQQLQGLDQGLELSVDSDLIGGVDRYQAYAFSANLIITSRRESYMFTCSTECYLLEPGDIVRLIVPWMNIDVFVRIYEKQINGDFTMSFRGSRYSRLDNDLYLTDRHPLPLVAEIPGGARPDPTPPQPDPLADAIAPTVSISALTSLDEETTHDFTADVSGGRYDTISYTWTVESGGGSISGSGSSITYTAPAVTSDTSAQIKCVVNVSGTGTNAANGTTASSEDTQDFTITDVAPITTPNAPQNLRRRGGGSGWFWVQWDAPASGGPTIDRIELRWSRDATIDSNDPKRTITGSSINQNGSVVQSGLSQGTYYIAAVSIGTDGGEASSNVIQINA